MANSQTTPETSTKREKQPVYVPAMIDEPLDITRLKRRITIALQATPDRVCGIAYRIGRIATEDGDQALYRLRLSMSHANYGTNTLPHIYRLKDGIFVELIERQDEGEGNK